MARKLADEALFAKVGLPTATLVVTLRTADEAALRVPEGGLTVAAGAAADRAAPDLKKMGAATATREATGAANLHRK